MRTARLAHPAHAGWRMCTAYTAKMSAWAPVCGWIQQWCNCTTEQHTITLHIKAGSIPVQKFYLPIERPQEVGLCWPEAI